MRNNYAVALAERGKLARARRVFGALGDPSGKDFEETYRATEGLLRYREGRIASARECYDKCRAALEKVGDFRGALISIVFQTSEEQALNHFTEAAKLIQIGESYAKRIDSRDLAQLLRDERAELEKLAADGTGVDYDMLAGTDKN